MSIARILLITLVISSVIVALVLFNLESDTPDNEVSKETSSTRFVEKPTVAPVVPPSVAPPPSIEDDAAMSPDEMVDDAKIEKEQVEEAMAKLHSNKDEERVEAVEQLGAYPNAETEATLVQLLSTDANAEVRNAAALSLGSMDEPTEAAISALMSAIEDQNEDVRFSALSTLEDFLLSQEEDSANYKRIREGLRQRAASRTMSQDLKDSINEILKDQELSTTPETEQSNQ